jgi:ribosome-associated heat shock protein Hsp15
VRLDKWLWAARFFKTRGLATEAVSGGKVHANGLRVKPARVVRVGDLLEIRKGAYTFQVEVLGLSDRRGPASVASRLYAESEESLQRREALRAQRRGSESGLAAGKPSKRDRRRILRFTRSGAE